MRASGSALRGVLSGVVAGAGAWAAHAISGAEVTPLAGAVALALSVGLGRLLAGGGDPLRIAALALGAQGLWHVVFMASAPADAPAGHDLVMLGAHVGMAVLSTAVAVGLDRVLVTAAARVAAALLPRPLVRLWLVVPPSTPGPVMADPVSPLRTAYFVVVRILRGPPAAPVSALGG